eukprot:4776036-Amphidinium_carterae.1
MISVRHSIGRCKSAYMCAWSACQTEELDDSSHRCRAHLGSPSGAQSAGRTQLEGDGHMTCLVRLCLARKRGGLQDNLVVRSCSLPKR